MAKHRVDGLSKSQMEQLILALEARVRELSVKVMTEKHPISREAYRVDCENVKVQVAALRAGDLAAYHQAARSRGYVEGEA